MNSHITTFESRYIDQLEQLPPVEWKSNAFDLFMHNEWQPWFHPFQVLDQQKLVGFGMLFHFGNIAWLGWILVHKNYRKQGIGTAISKHLVEVGTALGANVFVLTATDLGAPIYEKIGFKTTSYYRFFKSPERYIANYEKAKIRKACQADLKEIALLDQKATGENRINLLTAHLDETWVNYNSKIDGFYIPTLGNGFLAADTIEAGQNLFSFRMKKNSSVVVVPDQNIEFIDYLTKLGFSEGSKIPRMTLGTEPNWNPEMIYCRASGYCG